MFVHYQHNRLIYSSEYPLKMFNSARHGESITGAIERQERKKAFERYKKDFSAFSDVDSNGNYLLWSDEVPQESLQIAENGELLTPQKYYETIYHNVKTIAFTPFKVSYFDSSSIGCRFMSMGLLCVRYEWEMLKYKRNRGVDKKKFFARTRAFVDVLQHQLYWDSKKKKPILRNCKRANAKFFTMSFPQGTPDAIALTAWNNFATRFRKVNGKFSFIRVCERQKNGTIHFHFLSDDFINCKVWSQYVGKFLNKKLPTENVVWKNRGDVDSYSFLDISIIRDEKGNKINDAVSVVKNVCRASYYMVKYMMKGESTFYQPIAYSHDISKLSTSFNFNVFDGDDKDSNKFPLYPDSKYIIKHYEGERLTYKLVDFGEIADINKICREIVLNSEKGLVSRKVFRTLVAFNKYVFDVFVNKTNETWRDAVTFVGSMFNLELLSHFDKFELQRLCMCNKRNKDQIRPILV